jgi:coiled-coil domain-containing protein 115
MPRPPQTPQSFPSTIDDLLARYLLLLDQYTALRTTLSAHSSALFLGLARARFSAQRGAGAGGHPFGPDNFDMRMQAGRRVRVRPSASSATEHGGEEGAVFEVVSPEVSENSEKDRGADADAKGDDGAHTSDEQPQADGDKSKPAMGLTSSDPLRWFGILTPAPLREAQKEAVEMVEGVIPRLASLDAEMAAIELAVRRARKKRGKAEVAARRAEVEQQGVEVVAGEGGVAVGC